MNAAEHTRMGEKRNELLTDLASHAQKIFTEYEVPPTIAMIAASALMDHLADHWGGQNISFPKDFKWKLARKELEIYDQFHGNNYDALALAHGMTERGMRKLISRVRRKLHNRQQAGLFDPPGDPDFDE